MVVCGVGIDVSAGGAKPMPNLLPVSLRTEGEPSLKFVLVIRLSYFLPGGGTENSYLSSEKFTRAID